MSKLSKVKRALEGVQEKLEELTRASVRECAGQHCGDELKSDDKVFCSECEKSPKCEDCSEEILSGCCSICTGSRESAARQVAVGFYPHIGLPRSGAAPDQITAFLRTMVDTCCKVESRPCPRCADAQYLLQIYALHLGEVRA